MFFLVLGLFPNHVSSLLVLGETLESELNCWSLDFCDIVYFFFCGQKGFFVLFFLFVFSHDLFHLGFWIPGDLDPDLGFSLAWLVSVIRFCRLGFFIQT